MTTDSPGAIPPAPERDAREGRIRVAISIGATIALLASYFSPWWHVVDGSPPAEYPFVPVTAILNPYHGFSVNLALLMVGLPLLSALFAFLTLRGSRPARQLFATFSLIASLFCLLISSGMLFLLWSDVSLTHGIYVGGYVGWLASLLIFGSALSLSAALPGTASPSAPVPV